jgi:hypothetical protein
MSVEDNDRKLRLKEIHTGADVLHAVQRFMGLAVGSDVLATDSKEQPTVPQDSSRRKGSSVRLYILVCPAPRRRIADAFDRTSPRPRRGPDQNQSLHRRQLEQPAIRSTFVRLGVPRCGCNRLYKRQSLQRLSESRPSSPLPETNRKQ